MEIRKKELIGSIALSIIYVASFFVFPLYVSAQFTSTNYVIDSFTIGELRVDSSTSTNYTVGYQTGPEFTYDTATSGEEDSGGGGGGAEEPETADDVLVPPLPPTPPPPPPDAPPPDPVITLDDDEGQEEAGQEDSNPSDNEDGGGGGGGDSSRDSSEESAKDPGEGVISYTRERITDAIIGAYAAIENVFTNSVKVASEPVFAGAKEVGRFIAEAPPSVTQTVAATGILAALTQMAVQFFGAVTNAWTRMLTFLFSFVGIRRTRRWGVVYDAKTKRPIDPAIVTLQREDGTPVAEAITDLDGRYGFLVPPGTYQIIAQKSNYQFPSKLLAGKNRDIMYDNLYFGGLFDLREHEIVNRSIPMDPQAFDWNEAYKKQHHNYRFYSKKTYIRRILSYAFYGAGVLVAVVTAFVDPGYFNIALLSLYIVILPVIYVGILYRHPITRVLDKDGNPVAYALVTVFNEDRTMTFKKFVTDEFGQFYTLLPKGDYVVTVSLPQGDDTYTEVLAMKKHVTRGVLHENLSLAVSTGVSRQ